MERFMCSIHEQRLFKPQPETHDKGCSQGSMDSASRGEFVRRNSEAHYVLRVLPSNGRAPCFNASSTTIATMPDGRYCDVNGHIHAQLDRAGQIAGDDVLPINVLTQFISCVGSLFLYAADTTAQRFKLLLQYQRIHASLRCRNSLSR